MRNLFIFCISSIALCLTSCGREQIFQSQSYVFGTLVDITIVDVPEQHARELTNHVMQDFQGLHNRLHAWQASDLSTLNAGFAHGKKVTISTELAQIVSDATVLSQQSDGLFNPAIGGLIKAWGFQRSEFTAVQPSPEDISELVKENPQMTDIVLKDNVAYSNNPNVQLDLGGYAKGYALDVAAKYLRGQGVQNALINIGGNIIALGQHGDHAWRVGIQDPRGPSALATVDLADGWAIGTSGDYQRYFELNGKRYCHIINPHTGEPAQGTEAVTVLIPPQPSAGTLSDVLSKPIFLSSSHQRIKYIKKFNLEQVMVIDDQHHIYVTTALAKRLTWLDTYKAKHAQPLI